MNSKVWFGLSVAAGAVVAGGVYNFLHSGTAMQMSVGDGFIAGGVSLLCDYAKSPVARWVISAAAGVATILLVPGISWFISRFSGPTKSQPEQQRPVLEPKKIDLEGKEWVDDVCFYNKGTIEPSKIDYYGRGVKVSWLVTGKNDQDPQYDPVFDHRGARLHDLSDHPLFLDVNKYQVESRKDQS